MRYIEISILRYIEKIETASNRKFPRTAPSSTSSRSTPPSPLLRIHHHIPGYTYRSYINIKYKRPLYLGTEWYVYRLLNTSTVAGLVHMYVHLTEHPNALYVSERSGIPGNTESKQCTLRTRPESNSPHHTYNNVSGRTFHGPGCSLLHDVEG